MTRPCGSLNAKCKNKKILQFQPQCTGLIKKLCCVITLEKAVIRPEKKDIYFLCCWALIYIRSEASVQQSRMPLNLIK